MSLQASIHRNESSFSRLSKVSVDLSRSWHGRSPEGVSSVLQTKSLLHNVPSDVNNAYGTDDKLHDFISEMLYGVIVRGKWSGNAVAIAPSTFLSPKHLIGNVKDLNLGSSFRKYHSADHVCTEEWRRVFNRCVLLVPALCLCGQGSRESRKSRIMKVIAISRAPVSQSDAMLMYAIPLACSSMPLEKYMRNSLELKFDSKSLLKRCLELGGYSVVSLGKRLAKNEIMLIIWIDPMTNFRDFLDPTCISEWSFLHLHRDKPFRFSLCLLKGYIGHPQYFMQTCFTEISSSSYGLEILHSIRLTDFFQSHAQYVETTSAGASGGLVFHVKTADGEMDFFKRLEFVGIHIGKNSVPQRGNSPTRDGEQSDIVLGEFSLTEEMLRSIPHPMENFP